MCMIVVKPENVDIPNKSTLEICYKNNSDGVGVAYKKQGIQTVYIRKDFNNFKKFYNWLNDTIKKQDKLIIHFRLATHGLIDKGNRHPFPITRNIKLLRCLDLKTRFAVAHNGILPYGQHRKLSDTQKFIIDILASSKIKNNLKNKTIQKLITKFLNGDKLAIMTNDIESDILLFGKFIKHTDECYYSNEGFKTRMIYNTVPFDAYNNTNSYNNYKWHDIVDDYKEQDKLGRITKHSKKFCELCMSNKKDTKYYNDWMINCCKDCRELYIDRWCE